jgi:hypothetical protein
MLTRPRLSSLRMADFRTANAVGKFRYRIDSVTKAGEFFTSSPANLLKCVNSVIYLLKPGNQFG